MARVKKSLFRLQGSVYDLTFVASNAYRDHVRAPRGTYREAKPNKTLTRNFERTRVLNQTAKPVFDVLKESGKACREGFLWQHILSRFRKCESNQPRQLLQQLEGLELNRKYPLLPLFGNSLNVTAAFKKKELVVQLDINDSAFSLKKATAYRLAISVVYYYETRNRCTNETRSGDWMDLNYKGTTLSFVFPKRKSLCCLICIRMETRLHDVLVSGSWGNRMCVVRVI